MSGGLPKQRLGFAFFLIVLVAFPLDVKSDQPFGPLFKSVISHQSLDANADKVTQVRGLMAIYDELIAFEERVIAESGSARLTDLQHLQLRLVADYAAISEARVHYTNGDYEQAYQLFLRHNYDPLVGIPRANLVDRHVQFLSSKMTGAELAIRLGGFDVAERQLSKVASVILSDDYRLTGNQELFDIALRAAALSSFFVQETGRWPKGGLLAQPLFEKIKAHHDLGLWSRVLLMMQSVAEGRVGEFKKSLQSLDRLMSLEGEPDALTISATLHRIALLSKLNRDADTVSSFDELAKAVNAIPVDFDVPGFKAAFMQRGPAKIGLDPTASDYSLGLNVRSTFAAQLIFDDLANPTALEGKKFLVAPKYAFGSFLKLRP